MAKYLIDRDAVLDKVMMYFAPRGMMEWDMSKAVREIIENAPVVQEMPQWISVEDRLPPYEWENKALMATEEVLVINEDGQMFVGYFKVWKYEGSYMFDDGSDHDDITHWLPLPKPPEEDEV